MCSAFGLTVKNSAVVGPTPGSLQLLQMLLHCPWAAVGLERSGLRTGLPGDRDIIYMEAVCEGWYQELAELEMLLGDKKQPKAQRNHSKSVLM